MPTILHFEDDQSLAANLGSRLTAAGYRYVRFDHPTRDPLSLVRKERPDLIIYDVTMPVMDGFAAAANVLSDPQQRAIPFLFYTNLGRQEDINHGMSLGAARYFLKQEVLPAQLVRYIRTIVPATATPPINH